MKKTLMAVSVLMVLGLAAVAFAHGPGYGGHMAGPGHMGYGGYGGHMAGPGHMGYGGYGGHMMGPGHMGYAEEGEVAEFLEKTAELRREIHQKRFDHREALRTGDEAKAEALAKELDALAEKLVKATPESIAKGRAGYGNHCW